MDKQELRNALAAIEDEARRQRNEFLTYHGHATTCSIAALHASIAALAQLVRENIVK